MIDIEAQSENIRQQVQMKIKQKTRAVVDQACGDDNLKKFMMEQADLLGI